MDKMGRRPIAIITEMTAGIFNARSRCSHASHKVEHLSNQGGRDDLLKDIQLHIMGELALWNNLT